MALPATSSPSPPRAAHQDWLAEHTQHTHRNTSVGQKRCHDEVDEGDSRSSIASGLKRLRINPLSPLPQRPINGAHFRQHDQFQPNGSPALPNSSAFPTSHPAYLQPQHLTPLPSPLNLTPGKGSLAHYLSPNNSAFERNYTNTPPPQSMASSSRTSTWNGDAMTLDNPNIDTPNRVIINDLDAELAEIEAEEEQRKQRDQEQAFFLPDDVEKQMSSVPEHVLRSNGGSATGNPPPSQALILYKDPTSISMLEEEDAVHKAVREARTRLRDKQKDEPGGQHQQTVAALRVAAPPWPGFEPIMDNYDDFEAQRQYQEQAQHWDDVDDAMEIE